VNKFQNKTHPVGMQKKTGKWHWGENFDIERKRENRYMINVK
jgi:hypothetical protein